MPASSLTPEQHKELVAAVGELGDELTASLQRSEEGAKPVSLSEPIGRLSRMDAMQQQSMTQANRAAAKQRLGLVGSALLRIDENSYGDCVECESPVGFERLSVQPEALFCIECQRERETER